MLWKRVILVMVLVLSLLAMKPAPAPAVPAYWWDMYLFWEGVVQGFCRACDGCYRPADFDQVWGDDWPE